MNQYENSTPRPQEQPEPAATQEQKQETPEQHRAMTELEVAKIPAHQLEQHLDQTQQQIDALKKRIDAEREGKSTLSRWMAQAREKLGLLSEQEAADKEALRKASVRAEILTRAQIKDFGVGASQETAVVAPTATTESTTPTEDFSPQEKAWFAQGDAMHSDLPRVTMQDTAARRKLAKLLAERQLKIINDPNAKERILTEYAPQEQALKEQITQEDLPPVSVTVEVDDEEPIPVTVELDDEEEPIAVNVEFDDEEAIAATEIVGTQVAEDAPTTMENDVTPEAVAEDENDAMSGDDEDDDPKNVMPLPVPSQSAEQAPKKDDQQQLVEDEDVQSQIDALIHDGKSAKKKLLQWGLAEVVTGIRANLREEEIKQMVYEIGNKQGIPLTTKEPTLKEKFNSLLFETKKDAVEQPTLEKAFKMAMKVRNAERAREYIKKQPEPAANEKDTKMAA